jgi:hypothetical protein
MRIDPGTPIWQLTVADLLEILKEAQQPQPVMQQPQKKYVHGLAGIAELFGCSRTTASEIKKSGVIDGAITQVGRTIVVDMDLALQLAKNRQKRNKSPQL